MQRRCPYCNNIAILRGEYFTCPYCGTNFPRYETAVPIYEKQQIPEFDLTSKILTFVASFIFGIIAYLAFLGLFSEVEDNNPYTIAAFLIIFWIASVICVIFTFSPGIVYNFVKKYSSLDLTKFKHVLAFLIIILVFLWVIGIQLFVQVMYISESIFIKDKSVDTFLQDTADKLSLGALIFDLTLNLLIMGFGVIAYVILVYGDRFKPLEYLKIKFDTDTFNALGIGIVVGIVLFIISVIIFGILSELGMSQDNVIAEKMSDIIGKNLVLIFLIASFAAISEEIFFRGFLQKHIGIIPSSLLFGIVHIGYLTIPQVIGPFILGVVWCLLLKKTDNLAAPIASHFMVNFLALSLAL